MGYDLKELYDSIKYSYFYNNKGQFRVFTYEASLGKTTTMCEALKDLYKMHPEVHTLIVTKLKDEQEKIVKDKLGDMAKIINSDYKVNEDILFQYPILVITHEKYKILCKDKNRRTLYIEGRTNLIIDEQLDLMEVKEYNVTKADEMRNLLGQISYCEYNKSCDIDGQQVSIKYDLSDFWGKIIMEVNKSLINNYQKGKMKFVLNENDKVNEQINFLIKLIENAKFPKRFKNCNEAWRGSDAIKYKDTIKNYIEGIKCFFNNSNTIAQWGSLYAYNTKFRYFTLDNNIMLDASGKFLELYKVSSLFKVMESERVISHNNTTLTFLQNNSTTNSIEENESYYLKIAEYIMANINKEEDKVLIIGRKNDVKNNDEEIDSLRKHIPFEKDKIEFVNFDAMRGKNDWGDFNKCFVIHTPNRPFQQYPLQYLYYNEDLELSDDDLEITKINTNMGFVNETLENLRITDVASAIYQGLKRVNRNNDKECNYYVIVKDKRIQNILIEQFRDLKDIKFDKLIFEKKEYNMVKRNASSIKTQIIEWIDTIWDGSLIKTKDMLNEIGITQKQFDRVKEKDKALQDQLIKLSVKRGYYQKLAA